MPDEYTPIETNADRRRGAMTKANENIKEILGIEGTWANQLSQRANWKTIAKEAFSYLTNVVIPHGADEIGNFLYSGTGSGYWPGQGRGNAPIEPVMQPLEVPSASFTPTADANTPVSFDSTPAPSDHAHLYGVGQTPSHQPSAPDERPASLACGTAESDSFDKHVALYGVSYTRDQSHDMGR